MSHRAPRPGLRIATATSAALLVVATAISCGGAYEFETSTGGEEPRAALSGGGGSLPSYLSLAETSKDTTAFRGTRRVRAVRGVDVLETREDVGADGTGSFAIELLETISLTPEFEATSFPILYENAARFQWRVRDFRLRGLDRVALNYSINVLPTSPTVAGIVCSRIEFFRNTPIGGRPGHYEVDIDPRTGFVLAWREFDELGQPIFESIYETFVYDGDVSDLVLRDRAFSAQVLDLSGDLSQQSGANVRYPDVYPDGFDVVSGEVMDVPASISVGQNAILQPGRWLRFLASDGIETITFAHSDSQVVTAATTGEIMVLAVGAWEVGFGELAGTKFVIAGRVETDDLRRVIQSAF